MINKVDLVVLGFLIQEPMHGYRIAEFFEKRGIGFWVSIKQASVYKALARMVKNGHLESELKIEENERVRKIYYITEKGKTYFRELLDGLLFAEKYIAPVDFWNGFRFLTGNVDREYFKKAIQYRLHMVEEHQKEMEANRKKKHNANPDFELPFYLKLLFIHLQEAQESEKELLKEMLKAADLPENMEDFNKKIKV